MTSHDDAEPEVTELRYRAESKIREEGPPSVTLDSSKLRHELQVYQVELELQNEELRLANNALQAQFERYFAMFDAAPLAQVITDRRGSISDINLAASTVLNRPRARVVQQPLIAFLHPDDRGPCLAHLGRVFDRAGSVFSQQMYVRSIDGDVHMLMQSAWVPDPEGGAGHCLVSLVDITEQHKAQEGVERARLEAERHDRAKTEFVASLSHEIRTPLASIVAYADLLMAEGGLSGKVAERTQRITSAAAQVTSLLNDVLDLSKIESESIELRRDEFNPRQVVEDTANILQPSRVANEIAFDITVDDSVPENLVGDGNRYRQCLLNLCGNAVKFTPTGGNVAVQLTYVQGTLVTIVEDSGPGIPDTEKDSIFRPYRQVDNSDTRPHGGVGLGLAITQRLAGLMGGQILLSDSKLGGARFVLHVPFQPVGANNMVGLEALHEGRPYRERREGPILVVDDDQTIRGLLAALLEHLDVPHVIVDGGIVALEQLHARSFSALIVDMQMPDMDGLEVVRRVRTTPGIANIPVAALTAKALVHEVQECLDGGCDMHISKPVRIEELGAQIAQLLALGS